MYELEKRKNAATDIAVQQKESAKVQRKKGMEGLSYEAGAQALSPVQDAAQRGAQTSSSGLPHAADIQAGFGRHDISGIRYHGGADAAQTAEDMGAQAYTSGDHIVSGGDLSKHTAAHEAAHFVQQRAGVQLSGGVGQVGDAYEQHADAVADRVVQGKSAEDLLDAQVGAGGARGGSGAVQQVKKEDLVSRGERVEELAKDAPDTGMNVWKAVDSETGRTVHFLGTAHAAGIGAVGEGAALTQFLRSQSFTHVYSEIATDIAGIEVKSDIVETIQVHQNPPDRTTAKSAYIKWFQEKQNGRFKEMGTKQDDMYGAIALGGKQDRLTHSGETLGLEDKETRKVATEKNKRDLGVDFSEMRPDGELQTEEDLVNAGDNRALFTLLAGRMKEGKDYLDIEARNKQWVGATKVNPGDHQLWIVGASHLAGLVLRFEDLGWKVSSGA